MADGVEQGHRQQGHDKALVDTGLGLQARDPQEDHEQARGGCRVCGGSVQALSYCVA